MKRLLIVGAGGHAKVVYNIALQLNEYHIVGFVDTINLEKNLLFGYKIFHKFSDISEIIFDECIIAIGDNFSRKKIKENLCSYQKSIKFATLIDKSVQLGESVSIEAGTVIMPSATLNIESSIGAHCIINTNASIDHECSVDDFSSIGPGAVLGGQVKLGELSAVGLGANIIEKIVIEENVVIGAGSVVISNIKKNITVCGVPAKEIKKRTLGQKYLK